MIKRQKIKTVQVFMLFCFLFTFWTVSGQEGVGFERSYEKVFINGKAYYIHIVLPNQNLEDIAKAYYVTERDIMQLNRELVMGLEVGQALKIPVKEGQRTSFVTDSFVYHKVKKSQTLYYISKRYDIEISEIIDYNPEVKDGLKKGMVIKIPKFLSIPAKGSEEQKQKYVLHEVTNGETLFTISENYSVDIEDIQQINPGLIWDISPGQKIKVPKPEGFIEVQQDPLGDDVLYYKEDPLYREMPCDTYNYSGETFKVSVLLPFMTKQNSQIDSLQAKFYRNTKKILEYYEGILLAADSIRKKGLNLEITTYDTERSTKKVKTIINSGKLDDANLIIGPAYSDNVMLMADFAKEKQINMVSPFSQKKSILKFNPFVFQVRPTLEAGFEKLTHYLAKYYDQNFLVLHNDTKNEHDIIATFREKLKKSVSFNKGIETVVYKEINCSEISIDGLKNVLSVGSENVIFIPSEDEAFAMQILSKLHTQVENYRIVVFGMPEWQDFVNIEYNHLHDLQVHLFNSYYIDYDRYDVKRVIQKYRHIFKNEPDRLVLQSYDMAFYFFKNLKNHGKHFQFCIEELNLFPEYKGIQADFEFRRLDRTGGFENYGIQILVYTKNITFERINTKVRNRYFWDQKWTQNKNEEKSRKSKNDDKSSQPNNKKDEDDSFWNNW